MTNSGRTLAVVTGANGRLGGLITTELAAAGVDVLLVGRNVEALQRTAEQAQAAGKGAAHICVCDLEAADAIGTIVAAADRLGGCDVLVNNAAIQGPIGPLWEVDVAQFERAMRIDFLVPVELCRAVIPGMIARGSGWIVNLSGGGATGPRPFFSAYGAAKTALVRFGETLAVELQDKGVRVNAIAPGAFASGMTKAVAAASGEAGASEKKTADRLLANDDDSSARKAAKLAVYLVHGQGRDVTGKLISAVWDPWEDLHLRWHEIRTSDVYTLRRVVPAS